MTTLNSSGHKPAGFRIIIRMIEITNTTKGGILLTDTQVDKEQLKQSYGQVVAVGPEAYAERQQYAKEIGTTWTTWCKEGDWVTIASYAGRPLESLDGKSYRVVADTDIVTVLESDLVEKITQEKSYAGSV